MTGKRLGRALRPIARGLGLLLLGVLVAPVLAPGPAAIIDRGSAGIPRFGLFPLALAVFDPTVYDSAWNSLLAAGIATVASTFLGLAVGRALSRWSFWGRRSLRALAVLPLAMTPGLAAIGLSHGLGPAGPVGWLRPTAVRLGVDFASWVDWLALIWVDTAWGSAVVASVVIAALDRVDPAREDHARSLGIGRGRRWRRLVWPTIRPQVAGSIAAVFTATLFEPGAPIVLGLRRTLAYQAVEAARLDSADHRSRAAALALIGWTLVVLVRAALRRWGGDVSPPPSHAAGFPLPSPGTPRLLMFLGLVVGWASLALLPAACLVAPIRAAVGTGVSGLDLASGLATPLLHSVVLGGVVLLMLALLLRCLAPQRLGRTRGETPVGAGLEAFPRLGVGIGALVLPTLLLGLVGLLKLVAMPTPVTASVEFAARLLDPFAHPWIALTVASAATALPLLGRARAQVREGARIELASAAISLGAPRGRARRLMIGPRVVGPGLLVLALVATEPAPALVLTPTDEARPIGAAAILAHDQPGQSAAALAALGLAVHLTAVACVSRGEPARIGRWVGL